jgi:hypothetical protein
MLAQSARQDASHRDCLVLRADNYSRDTGLHIPHLGVRVVAVVLLLSWRGRHASRPRRGHCLTLKGRFCASGRSRPRPVGRPLSNWRRRSISSRDKTGHPSLFLCPGLGPRRFATPIAIRRGQPIHTKACAPISHPSVVGRSGALHYISAYWRALQCKWAECARR